MTLGTRILGWGSYVPENVWTNDDLKQFMDTSDEWIQQRTGIKQRHWVDENSKTTTSDLALKAAEAAIAKAGIKKEQIDMILFATISPDHEFPGTGCFFQAKLGLPGIPAIDVRQQCTGFIYALSIADQFIKTGMIKTALVVGAEVHSKGLDKSTKGRDVSVLFGDGAGAFVVGATEVKNPETDPHIISTHLHADGNYAKELWISAPGMAIGPKRVSTKNIEYGEHFAYMNGKTVFIHATKRMPEVILEALEKNKLKIDDIDFFVFHQANQRINEMVSKQLGIPESKVLNTIDKYANTTAATIPIGFDEALKAGKIKPGMLVAVSAFGSGFTWASGVIRWG